MMSCEVNLTTQLLAVDPLSTRSYTHRQLTSAWRHATARFCSPSIIRSNEKLDAILYFARHASMRKKSRSAMKSIFPPLNFQSNFNHIYSRKIVFKNAFHKFSHLKRSKWFFLLNYDSLMPRAKKKYLHFTRMLVVLLVREYVYCRRITTEPGTEEHRWSFHQMLLQNDFRPQQARNRSCCEDVSCTTKAFIGRRFAANRGGCY